MVLSFDPDAAGQGAAARSCELLVAEGFDVNVVGLDKGEDPDTFIRQHGAERYRERLRGSRPYLEYLLDRAASGRDFGDAEKRREFRRFWPEFRKFLAGRGVVVRPNGSRGWLTSVGITPR